MNVFVVTIHIIYIVDLKVRLSQCFSPNEIPLRSAPRMPAPIVLIEDGPLRGLVNINWKGGEFFSFLSIPYARKPIRELRFKDPKSPETWNSIRDATVDMPQCVQHDINLRIIGTEDCLYLNVHTPRLTGRAPVMVFIHGGGYLGSSGKVEYLGPEFLLAENIVLVTLNYRLGFFGFLNFDDPTVGVPGNAGMKDQVMALQWVQANIHKFGGDPESVTIFGQCVGATSVHLHMMSPLSQLLFHRSIALSGTALHSWAMGSKDTGLVVAKMLGYRTNNPHTILNRLQKAKVRRIMRLQEDIALLPLVEKNLIGPVVEPRHNGTVFLSESPYLTLAKGTFKKCPFILGVTDRPSLIYEIVEFRRTGMITAIEEPDIAPYTLSLNKFTSQLVCDEIMEAYDIEELRAGTYGYRQLIDDLFMNYFVYVTATKHAKMNHTEMYLYKFSASTRLNFFKFSTRLTATVEGASHMDEIGYLFRNPKTPSNLQPRSKESDCVHRFIKLFVNFAKGANPTPRGNKLNVVWRPVKNDKLSYLHFRTNSMRMKVEPFERMRFWDSIYSRFGSECTYDYVTKKKKRFNPKAFVEVIDDVSSDEIEKQLQTIDEPIEDINTESSDEFDIDDQDEVQEEAYSGSKDEVENSGEEVEDTGGYEREIEFRTDVPETTSSTLEYEPGRTELAGKEERAITESLTATTIPTKQRMYFAENS